MTEKQLQRIEEIRAMHGKYALLHDKSREEVFLLQGVYDLLEIVKAQAGEIEAAYKQGHRDGFMEPKTPGEAKGVPAKGEAKEG